MKKNIGFQFSVFTLVILGIISLSQQSHAGQTECPVEAETCLFEPDSTVDTPQSKPQDANLGDGICKSQGGACTLRAAIEEANKLKKPTTIQLQDGYYYLYMDEFKISDAAQVTLLGKGADKTFFNVYNNVGGLYQRAFNVSKDKTILNIEGIAFRNSEAVEDGAVIYNGPDSTVNIKNSKFTFNASTFQAVKVNNQITTQGGHGSVIYNDHGTVTIDNSLMESNFADKSYSFPANWTQNEKSTATNLINIAIPLAAVIYNSNQGIVKITRGTFTDNDLYYSGGKGGAIYNSDGKVYIVNSTFSGNGADKGDAIYNIGGEDSKIFIANSTLIGGPSTIIETSDLASIHLKNSIVSNGTLFLDPNPKSVCSGTVKSWGYNIFNYINKNNCPILAAPGDRIGFGSVSENPLLGIITSADDTSKVHPLVTGSPAVDGGDPKGCTDFQEPPQLIDIDQRGFARPVPDIKNPYNNSGTCDIGAFEIVCGDGYKQALIEECDDGNDVEGDGCDSNCTITSCGNKILSPDEECDDGNNQDGDGCNSHCELESSTDGASTAGATTTGGDTSPPPSEAAGGCVLNARVKMGGGVVVFEFLSCLLIVFGFRRVLFR